VHVAAESLNLSSWQNFYVIVGSSGGALVGLQFVVIALIASTNIRADAAAVKAFGTPNVVHFSMTLIVSAVMNAPWSSVSGLSVVLAICGLFGLAHSASVFYRARRQTTYKPVAEDWCWYAILPCCIYTALIFATLMLKSAGHVGLFMIAGSALGLLVIGIRNAWDTVTHIVVGGQSQERKTPQ